MINSEKNFKEFGWQDINCLVPSDWEPAVINGNHEKGFVRFDDGFIPRLEIKWQEAKHGFSTEKTLKKYFKKLENESKLHNIEFSPEKNPVIFEKDLPSMKGFDWHADFSACGIIYHCQACKRAVIAQVLFRRNKVDRSLARKILLSITDHSSAGSSNWSVYDCSLKLPACFRLYGQRLESGFLELDFKNRHHRVKLLRWGMAEQLLKQESIKSFLEKRLDKNRELSFKEENVNGHPSVSAAGCTVRHLLGIRKTAAKVFRRQFYPHFIHRAWQCPASNRLYSVEIATSKKDELEDLREKIRVECQ